MSINEKEKYFAEAKRLRLLHKQQHPKWSNRDNYVRTACSHMRKQVTAQLWVYPAFSLCLQGKKLNTRDRRIAAELTEGKMMLLRCKFFSI